MDCKLIIVIALFVLLGVCFLIVRHFYVKKLRREIKRAQTSERIKSVFLANVSHALRTPLNAIIGFSDVILMDKQGDMNREEIKEVATHINENGQQLFYFISQLLELSNFESSVLSFTMIEVNLAEMMASYRREVLHVVNSGVSVLVRSDLSPHCKARLDTNLMHQLMMNLLNNAAHRTKKGCITLNYGYERRGLRVVITDTGECMPKEVLDGSYSVLQNEDSLTLSNRTNELGLSICKSIVEALGGEMSITSEPDKGTTASIWFGCRMRHKYQDL
ncbi:His Kinase A (phospho-acceptor) domain-containing protein [Xylanibacter ruminicola]|jgi:K+-sensing histidine kinase KdpD|uniref:histidine kinase n=1 Tax=Xylanibacter ruminicola TaxID=839 RepID=A0A1H5X4Z4_XYLRU|nr:MULTISPECIES: HAMP domain-containing sensor histidine kinase [Prevotellaceae]SEG06879.1 His Kinase A (phospho-acceptor) domain-containing protein [Xylanibacter ruminicola]SEV79918.1 His Kinase A (phospho-acceptor) domain-containing protein [Prevotella sp. khp7]